MVWVISSASSIENRKRIACEEFRKKHPVLDQFFVLDASFSTKVLVFCWLFMQVRWTLPRFRYDQLMRLGWLGLFPISVANVLVTALVLAFFSEGF